MASLWEAVTSTFWSEWFWLPVGTTWKDLESQDEGIFHPQASDMIILVPLAVFLLVLRQLFERYVSKPIGTHFGLSDADFPQAPSNVTLEHFFTNEKKPVNEDYVNLSKQTDLSRRQIERWFRLRRNQDRTKTIIKFSESSWRFVFYVVIFWYGVWCLYDKPWVWDRTENWRGWPHHHVPNSLYWYYAIEAGFYLSLLITLFSDVKRKDFSEMVVHHICTLGLLFCSYVGNLLRIGSLVLVVHDSVDSWLEAAKLAKYLTSHDKKWQKVCDSLFLIFFIVWICTRMALYPAWIVYNTLVVSLSFFDILPLYFLINGMLIMLQILHIFWTGIILKIVIGALRKGEIEKDARSDSDMEMSDSNDSPKPLNDTPNSSSVVTNGVQTTQKRVTRSSSAIKAKH